MDLILGGTIWGNLSLIPALLIPRSIAEKIPIALAGLVGIDLSHGNGLTALGGLTSANLANALPPGYRPPGFAMTRRYKRLNDLLLRVGQNPVLLDGIFGFDDMSTERPIAYRGRGVFYSEQVTAPSLVAPISVPIAGDNKSYLVIHHEAPVRQANRGGAMLTIRANGDNATVNAAIYATQGVKPAGKLILNGLYTCGFLNKSQIPDGSELDVTYRPSPVTGVVTAISPRTAMFLEK